MILLSDLISEYLLSVAQTSVKSLSYYLNDFLLYCTNKHIDDITVNDIQHYINNKQNQELKDTTIYRYYSNIKTLFNYAISHECLEKNPCARR